MDLVPWHLVLVRQSPPNVHAFLFFKNIYKAGISLFQGPACVGRHTARLVAAILPNIFVGFGSLQPAALQVG